MKETVKGIMEEAFKRVLEEHNLRIDRVNCEWITCADGECYPMSIEVVGDAV